MPGKSEQIKNFAASIGFTACGISRAAPLPDASRSFELYLKEHRNGIMEYLEKSREQRHDPREILPEAKSVISVMMNYFPQEVVPEDDRYVIAKYAYGKDYHVVIKEKLNRLSDFLVREMGSGRNRSFVDSAPVFEKAWAGRAGLGWIGKNTILINPDHGSFCFLGEILTDLELEPDQPMPDHCGNCSKCMEACPTGALVAPRNLDASLCISYWTIENRGPLPGKLKGKFRDRIFGCDICQDVCPFNWFVHPHNEDAFLPGKRLFAMKKKDWKELDDTGFDQIFSGTPVNRAGRETILRTIGFIEEE